MSYTRLLAILLVPAALSAYQLARNGGFELLQKNARKPQDWFLNINKNSDATMTLDDENVAAGKYSLKIDVMKPAPDKGNNALNHWSWLPKPLDTPAICNVDVDVCAVNLTDAGIIFQTQDENNKILTWKTITKLANTFPWKHVSATMDVPAGTKRINLSFRCSATGTLWVDNVSLDLKPLDDVPKSLTLDFSGDTLPETGLPKGWLKKEYTGNENVSSAAVKSENGKTFAEQIWKTGAAHAGFTARIPDAWLKSKAIQLSAELQTSNGGKADIGLEFFNNKGVSLGEAMARDITAKDWSTVTFAFIPPHDAESLAVVLNNTGMGTVRFAAATVAAAAATDKAITLGTPAIRVSCYPVKHSCDQQHVKFPEFNTFTDSPTKLTFHFSGDRKRMVKPTLCIDVPEDVTIPAAICPHPNTWCSEKFTAEPLKRPEGNYTRYTFVNVRGMQLAYPEERYQRRMVVVFTPVIKGTTFTGKKVFYHLENNGTPMPEDAFNLNMLPPMPKTPNPRNFVFWRWNDEDFTWPGDDLFLATIKCQEEANYMCVSRYPNTCATRMKEVRDIAAKRGWTLVARAGVNHHDTHLFKKIEKENGIKAEFAVRADGRTMDNTLCPTFISCNPDIDKLRDDALRNDLLSRNVMPGDFMLLDSEEWSPMDWCFCDRCRTFFAKLNKISPVPDAATIKKNHAPKWRDFRTMLAARQIENNARIARELKLKVGDYNYVNDYSKPNYRDRYYSIAKDTLQNEPFQDLNLISYYHTLDAAAFDMHKGERLTLKKPFVPICAIDGVGSYLSLPEVLTPQRFRMMILAAAVNGSAGYSIYPGERLDAKFYIAADKAMAEIAANEDILRNGSYINDISAKPLPLKESTVTAGGNAFTISFPKWNDSFRYNVRQLNGKTLVCLLNFNPEHTAFVQITLDKPIGNRTAAETSTRKIIQLKDTDDKFLVAVPPMDALFIEISHDKHTDWTPYTSQEQLNSQFKDAQKAADAQNASLPQTWNNGKLAFQYITDEHDNPMPVLKNERQTIVIDAAHGGHVAQWIADGQILCEAQSQWLARNRLWTPQNGRGDNGNKRNSTIKAAADSNGKATLTLENSFDDVHVTLMKTFTIDETTPAFNVTSTYRNDSDKTISLIGWCHNLINPGNIQNTLEHGDIQYSADGTPKRLPRELLTVRLEAPNFNSLPKDDRSFNSTLKTDRHEVTQLFPKLKKAVRYSPDPKLLSSYNCYNSIKASTVEWMYGAVTLKPGQAVTFTEAFACENLP